MAITPKFTPKSVADMLQKKMEAIEQAIVNRLRFVGEAFVKNARNNGAYKDQTGNLRSSVGYVILKNGEQIYGSAFNVVKDGRDGQKKGLQLVDNLSSQHTKGYVLIVVAGMEYAAAVESKNLDVLTASSITAENDLKKSIEELGAKIPKMR